MQPAAFLAIERGADDEASHLDEVAQFDEIGGDPEIAIIIRNLLA